MKTYQDTETGKLHEFEDGVDPFKLNYRSIPATLSENVVYQPSESHVWFQGAWIKDTDAPKDYKPPVSSVPAYNPAWAAFIKPYTILLPDDVDEYKVSLEQVNTNNYDNDKLSVVVTTLPSKDAEDISTLISFDGAISIPRNIDFPSNNKAIEEINLILCAILIGGIHTEVIHSQELFSGSLENEKNIFIYNPSLHSRLRHKEASISERMTPLMHPRILHVSELSTAYIHGIAIINSICNFTPFFLLHGYTAMTYQNKSDALSSFWVVVEQLTSFIWETQFFPKHNIDLPNLVAEQKRLNGRFNVSQIWGKHILLFETKFITKDCFDVLNTARGKRNKIAHEGLIPDFKVIGDLWGNLHELFELASKTKQINMRRLTSYKAPELGVPEKIDFSEWLVLSKKFSDD